MGVMTIGMLHPVFKKIARHKAAAGFVLIAVSTGLWAVTTAGWLRGAFPMGSAISIESPGSAAQGHLESNPSGGTKGTLDDALKFGTRSRAAVSSVADYTAVLTKTELVGGALTTQTMDVKCRSQPFSIYLANHRRGGKGREVIYVAGANNGNLLVHEAGLKAAIGTLQFKPDCKKVMETNRHPITDVGLVRLIESAMSTWENDKREADPAQVDVQFIQNVKVGSAECNGVQITHRQKRPRINYQIGRVYVEIRTGFPIQAEIYGWPGRPGAEPPLLERYTYSDIKTNVGLTAHDFDPQNSDYEFVSRD
jgi:hypothetical protein